MESLTYSKKQNLKLRPFAPWHAAIVYTPDEPAHHWLNSTSWLILEMCDGANRADLIRRFAKTVPEKSEQATAIIDSCLQHLRQKGLITADPSGKNSQEEPNAYG